MARPILTGLIFWAIMALSSGVFAQEGKIGFIDSNRLRNELKDFKDAQSKLEKEVADWQKIRQAKQDTINQLQDEYDKQKIFLSEEKRKEKEAVLAQKKKELAKFNSDIFGPEGKVVQRDKELTKPILDKINQALERLATDNNYAMILDAVNGNVAYARKNMDLTDKLLQELQK